MEIKNELEKKNLKKIKRDVFDSRKFQCEFLSNQKKLENEISSLPKEFRNEFRGALNKYSFDKEILIPKAITIYKNDYKDKNYLLNNLVSFENKAQERKDLVEPLRKETKRFSKQYKLILEENEYHQNNYLRKLAKIYKSLGYNINNIEFQKTENIFSPSVILDHNFGINIMEDIYKYSNFGLSKEYKIDQNLLRKIKKGIKDTKVHKNMKKTLKEENEMKGGEIDEIKEKEKEKELKYITFQKEIEKVKNTLEEENIIKNMTKQEYFKFNKKIKNDIQTTKRLLKEFFENKNSNSYYYPKKITLKNLEDNNIQKTINIIHPSKFKNYQEKIVFSSNEILKEKNDKDIKKTNNKNIFIKNLKNNFNIKQIKDKNSPIMTQIITPIKTKNEKRNFLPKLSSMLNTGHDISTSVEIKSKNYNEIFNDIKLKKIKKGKDLNNTYNLVCSNKTNMLEKYPTKSVELYFKKYTKKKIPKVNYKKGSNIHGLLDDFQYVVRKKDFYKVAESSNDVKKEIRNKRDLSYNKIPDEVNLDVNKIQDLDDKIPDLHYILAENLLMNRARKNRKF